MKKVLLFIVLILGIFFSGCVTNTVKEQVSPTATISPQTSPTVSPVSTQTSQSLEIVFKDPGLPEVKYLQPTTKEVQMLNEGGRWITIWSSPEGKTVKLTPDGAEVVLDTVSVEAGTYVGTRLLVSSIDVEVDINRDGDTLDKNVEIVLTREEFERLPPKNKPPGELGVRIEGGLVYMGQYLDEKHTATPNGYIEPKLEAPFVYGGSGGKIIYDFTLHPLEPKHEQISVKVSTTT